MTSAFRPHRAGSRRSPEGSRACLARSGDCEPSLGAMGVLRRCCSGGGASLCRKLCRVGHRYRGQHCSRGRCRHRQNNLPPTPTHWRAGRGAAWWRRRGLMRARRAPSFTICSLAGSVVRCGTRVSCELFLASHRVSLGTALALELLFIPETPHESLQIRITQKHRALSPGCSGRVPRP